MLALVLPATDQCVKIDDPLSSLLDRIQAGDVNNADVRYFLSRLRTGEGEEQDASASIEIMRRSFAAFQARKAGNEASVESKLASLRDALDAEAQAADVITVKTAAFSGMQLEPLTALAARIAAEMESLPTTIIEWCYWLIDFMIGDRASYAALFGPDVETVKAVTRGKKAGGDSSDAEMELLKPALHLWLTGAPYAAIEASLGVSSDKIKTCKRARDFVMRLMNRRLYMIAGALSVLVQHALNEAGQVSANPAALEILPIAIRKGLASPEQVAFALRSPMIRSRVVLHRTYTQQFSSHQDLMGTDFQTVLHSVDARIGFQG
ncbi:MAG: hypothetical protein ER33_15120 [Cyanobium sp. CACIAM 14]|nr:MAG: hypothetical protein ER33_15120 [Cyanobium sp. CACIAM 14]